MCVEELSSQVHEDLWNANLKVRNEITWSILTLCWCWTPFWHHPSAGTGTVMSSNWHHANLGCPFLELGVPFLELGLKWLCNTPSSGTGCPVLELGAQCQNWVSHMKPQIGTCPILAPVPKWCISRLALVVGKEWP
jgi:hypothetical protein